MFPVSKIAFLNLTVTTMIHNCDFSRLLSLSELHISSPQGIVDALTFNSFPRNLRILEVGELFNYVPKPQYKLPRFLQIFSCPATCLSEVEFQHCEHLTLLKIKQTRFAETKSGLWDTINGLSSLECIELQHLVNVDGSKYYEFCSGIPESIKHIRLLIESYPYAPMNSVVRPLFGIAIPDHLTNVNLEIVSDSNLDIYVNTSKLRWADSSKSMPYISNHMLLQMAENTKLTVHHYTATEIRLIHPDELNDNIKSICHMKGAIDSVVLQNEGYRITGSRCFRRWH
ncbi:unnamed protein product [Ambrosiozyma monospora]|uniref:Unnamed protein product n=1 Tax=Ambrosiozyma monospora TaxID=43982 RepID=A0A9W6YV68_AMBMO|nr:unnamed protein product [Ambrosiozyma monospora]